MINCNIGAALHESAAARGDALALVTGKGGQILGNLLKACDVHVALLVYGKESATESSAWKRRTADGVCQERFPLPAPRQGDKLALRH